MTFFYWKHKAKLELTRKKMYTANALVLWRHPVLSTNCINPSWSFRLPIGNPKKCYPWSFFKPPCTIYHTTTHWHCSWTKDLTDPLLNLLPKRALQKRSFCQPPTSLQNTNVLSNSNISQSENKDCDLFWSWQNLSSWISHYLIW